MSLWVLLGGDQRHCSAHGSVASHGHPIGSGSEESGSKPWTLYNVH